MRTKPQSSQRKMSWPGMLITLTIIILFGCSQKTFAQQWSTSGNDISNSNSGNVGVGKSSPGYKLDVLSSINVIARFDSSASANTQVLINAASGYNANLTLQRAGVGKWSIGNIAANDRLSFINASGTTEAFTLLQNGNIGIGTNAPSVKLELHHSSSNTNLANLDFPDLALGIRNTSNTNGNMSLISFQDSVGYGNAQIGAIQNNQTTHVADIVFFTRNAEAFGERLRIKSDGAIGIGTTSPTLRLDVQNAGANGAIRSVNESPGIRGLITQQHSSNQVGAVFVGLKSRGTFAFPSAVTVDDFGGFLSAKWYDGTSYVQSGGIGFQVDGPVSTGVVPTRLFFITSTTSGDGASAHGVERMTILSGGNVGIGTTIPSYKLDVAGTINATGLNINGTPIVSGVASAFGRTGAVVAATNDYTWAQINKSVSSLGDLQTRSASDLSSGTLPDARFPATLPAASGVNLTALNASNLASGTVATARLGSGTANTTTFLRGDNTWQPVPSSSQWTSGTNNISYSSGDVGIGTTTPGAKLEVVGNVNVSGTGNITAAGTIEGGNIKAKYQDVAEWVESSQELPTGTLVVLDHTKSNQVIASSQAYDTRVAGVITERPGITLGEGGNNKVLVATTGRVRLMVDASKGPIQIGDLLVTSDIPGVAMKSEAINVGGVQIHRPGTLVGKALEPLDKGQGKILVLLSLQ